MAEQPIAPIRHLVIVLGDQLEHGSTAFDGFDPVKVAAYDDADRARLLARDGRIDCLNCGAALGETDAQCPYCASVPSLLRSSAAPSALFMASLMSLMACCAPMNCMSPY